MLAPTLIVGLGGIGSKITAKLSAMITNPKQMERINFVVFDTDANELGRIERESRVGKGKKVITVQTSTNMTVGDYLHLDEYTRDNSFPVNPNLYRKTLSEGAGQVRAISHLAFVTAMKRGYMEPLDNAIYDLYKLESVPSTQVLRIIIVSTLAGGTGSGLILPVSMYIKQFLKTKIQIPGSITRGFFILPEILYSAVTAEPMRNAFKSNAYAVLRELNAFILKADGNLPERYKDKVHLMFPKIGTGEFEEYDVLPMDFCFMFDAQNIEGKKLNSTEQYLDHAATCIYAQSIGPMNTRSYSSEDNVIRTLVSGQSRNRYAGAGASELVYPSEHILRYIALKWAAQTVTDHWTVFDRDFHKMSIENNRAKLKGKPVSDIDRAEQYISSIDMADEKGNDYFASFTRNASYQFDKDGFTEIGRKWNGYIDALDKFVHRVAEKGQSEINNIRDTAKSSVEALSSNTKERMDMETFRDAYTHLLSYKEYVTRNVDKVGREASYVLFESNDGKDVILEENPTQIETYLRGNSKEFMHPNAARYFLYQTLQILKKKLAEAEKNKTNAETRFKAFDTLFDDPTTETTETIGNFLNKVDEGGFWARITKKYEGEIKRFVEEYESLFGTIADYRVNAPYVLVLTAAVKYVRNLCEAFEKFYDSFDNNVSEITQEIINLEDKYSPVKGNTVRYVCASKKCLDKFYEKMEFKGSAIQIPEELCKQIYRQVRHFSLSPEIKTDKFFRDIFDNEILKHFMTSVMEAYSTDIKMDIIRALETEAKYEEGIEDRKSITEYVKQVIKDTKTLADPFINRPVGEETVRNPACAYNKKIITDDPERRDLVLSELKSFGGDGFEDDEIDNERILFYNAIYGLFPEDLLKFSPPEKSKTVTLEAGEYYKSYFDMINRIEPDTLTTRVITPHIHKYWHLISEMPDLNNELQEKQEMTIYKALVLGLLYGCIKCKKLGNKLRYRLWLDDKMEVPLVVSNGTPCDTFYQIVDALTINPVIVKKILVAIDNKLEAARKNNIIKFEKSALSEGLSNLTLRELSGEDSGEKPRLMSIFGIAVAFKATMPPDDFIVEQGLTLLETILETLYEQIEILCPETERDTRYVELVENQLKLFTGNFDLYKKNYPSVLDDYLERLLHVVKSVLIGKGFTKDAERISKSSEHLFTEDTQNKGRASKKDDEAKAE